MTAAETLMPRAYGQERYGEVGFLAIRGLLVSTVLLLPPIIFLCIGMEWLFQRLGQDPEASKLASEWIRIYSLAIPSFLLFRVVEAFLNAQHVVLPLVFGSLSHVYCHSSNFVKAHCALTWFDRIHVVYCNHTIWHDLLVMLYLKVRPEHHSQSCPGLSRDIFLEAPQPGPLWVFSKLCLGGALSSEWCPDFGEFHSPGRKSNVDAVFLFCTHTI